MSSLMSRTDSPFAVLLLGLVALVLAGFSQPAAANAVFRYSSTCGPLPCPDIGLDVGDPVAGLLAFPDAVVVPNGHLTAADLIGLELDFGSIDIDLASVAAISFDAVLDGGATGFISFSLIVSDALNAIGGLIQLETFAWGAAVGGCLSPDCFDLFFVDGSFGLDPTIALVAEVPEPATALLLALAGGALLVRRTDRTTPATGLPAPRC